MPPKEVLSEAAVIRLNQGKLYHLAHVWGVDTKGLLVSEVRGALARKMLENGTSNATTPIAGQCFLNLLLLGFAMCSLSRTPYLRGQGRTFGPL